MYTLFFNNWSHIILVPHDYLTQSSTSIFGHSMRYTQLTAITNKYTTLSSRHPSDCGTPYLKKFQKTLII